MSRSRRFAYVALVDDELRAAVIAALHRQGWATQQVSTGVDLVRAVSGRILGDETDRSIGLIVAQDPLPGCRGSSIASGLRALAIDIPVVLVDPRDGRDAVLEEVIARASALAADLQHLIDARQSDGLSRGALAAAYLPHG